MYAGLQELGVANGEDLKETLTNCTEPLKAIEQFQVRWAPRVGPGCVGTASTARAPVLSRLFLAVFVIPSAVVIPRRGLCCRRRTACCCPRCSMPCPSWTCTAPPASSSTSPCSMSCGRSCWRESLPSLWRGRSRRGLSAFSLVPWGEFCVKNQWMGDFCKGELGSSGTLRWPLCSCSA